MNRSAGPKACNALGEYSICYFVVYAVQCNDCDGSIYCPFVAWTWRGFDGITYHNLHRWNLWAIGTRCDDCLFSPIGNIWNIFCLLIEYHDAMANTRADLHVCADFSNNRAILRTYFGMIHLFFFKLSVLKIFLFFISFRSQRHQCGC